MNPSITQFLRRPWLKSAALPTLVCLFLLAMARLGHAQAQANTAQFEDIISEPNVQVTMRDGVSISLDIYRPAKPGRYPALYASGPFPHNDDSVPPDNNLTGPVAWYVSQGYVYVLASSRGTGQSQGDYAFLSRDEQQDHYEIVEWIAQQEWSNQKVAGIGAGYYATSQWMMAIQNPPHLSCIAPYDGVLDPYRDWAYPGGLASSEFTLDWYDTQVRQANAFPTTGPATLVSYDLRLQQLMHPHYDDYWKLRSSQENLAEIDVPVFILRDWDQRSPGAASTLRAADHLNSVNKILLTSDSTSEGQYSLVEFHQQELLPFYQWCLKDEGTTFIERPRLRYSVRGQDQVKRDSTWPPGNITYTPLYLNRDGDTAAQDATGTLGFEMQQSNPDYSDYGSDSDNTSLRFVSAPLERDMEITGPLMMELYISSSADDTAFEVTVSEDVVYRQFAPQTDLLPSFLNPDVSADMNLLTATNTRIVSSGILKASARMTDEQRSAENQPYYSATASSPLTPGQVYRLEVALQPTAYHFHKGNRIELEIHKAVDGSLARLPSRDTVYHGNQYQSRLWLPLVQSITNNSTSQAPAPAADGEADLPDFNSVPSPVDDLFNSDNPVIFVPH